MMITTKQVNFNSIKALKETKKKYMCMVECQNVFIILWWAAMLLSLRTTEL